MQNHWIFQYARPIDDLQCQNLAQSLKSALDGWQAHKVPVDSQFEIRYNRFLFVKALSDVSGCSIDWMTNTVKTINAQLGLELADEGSVFYQNGDQIDFLPFNQMQLAIRNGQITYDTLIYDQTVANQNVFDGFEKKVNQSWLKRFLPTFVHA